jgi:hypothetical protein
LFAVAVLAVVGTATASSGPAQDAKPPASQPTVSIVGVAYTVIDIQVPLAPATDDPAFLSRVQAALQPNLGELQRCYEGRLDAGQDLNGTMAMEYVISPAGKFVDGCLADVDGVVQMYDSDLGDCIRDLSVATRYPRWPEREAPSRAVTVTYRFSPPLTAGAGSASGPR